jgi:hypothetical protein
MLRKLFDLMRGSRRVLENPLNIVSYVKRDGAYLMDISLT